MQDDLSAAFTDPQGVLSMESEHLPLWKAFVRVFEQALIPGARVLDFGCNRGGLLFLLAADPRPVSFMVGVDVDTASMRQVLKQAAEAARAGGLPIVFTTTGPEAFPSQIDLVISHEVVYLLPDLRGAFSRILAALAPEGAFCFTTGCHTRNPLWPRWRRSLRAQRVPAHDYSPEDFEAALRGAGFVRIRRDRLCLTPDEYDAWVADRGTAAPNPDWFPGAAAERRYYTQVGKLVITADKG